MVARIARFENTHKILLNFCALLGAVAPAQVFQNDNTRSSGRANTPGRNALQNKKFCCKKIQVCSGVCCGKGKTAGTDGFDREGVEV